MMHGQKNIKLQARVLVRSWWPLRSLCILKPGNLIKGRVLAVHVEGNFLQAERLW